MWFTLANVYRHDSVTVWDHMGISVPYSRPRIRSMGQDGNLEAGQLSPTKLTVELHMRDKYRG